MSTIFMSQIRNNKYSENQAVEIMRKIHMSNFTRPVPYLSKKQPSYFIFQDV